MCGTLTSILISGIDDSETLSIYKEMYLDSNSRRRECVMARMVNTVLQGDSKLAKYGLFPENLSIYLYTFSLGSRMAQEFKLWLRRSITRVEI